MTLAAVGDCIVTRKISHRRDPDFLALAELLRGVDCAWGNCELRLRRLPPGLSGAEGGRSPCHGAPWGADELAWMGIDFVGVANNHILDFGNEGMFSTLENLDRVGIAHAGAGADLAAAARPGLRRHAGRADRAGQLRLDLPQVLRRPRPPTRI